MEYKILVGKSDTPGTSTHERLSTKIHKEMAEGWCVEKISSRGYETSVSFYAVLIKDFD